MVNIEAKKSLRSSIMIQNLDICYPKKYHLSNNISVAKMQIHGTTIREPLTKKSKRKKVKPADDKTSILPHSNKTAKFNCQKKKKEH